MRVFVLLLAAVLLAPTAHAVDFDDPCEKLGAQISFHAFAYLNGARQAQKIGCFEEPPPAGGYSPQCDRLRNKTMGDPWDAYWTEKEEWYARKCQTSHCLHLDFLNPWGMDALAVNPEHICRSKPAREGGR